MARGVQLYQKTVQTVAASGVHADVYLACSGAASLLLERCNGNLLTINGEDCVIPAGGDTLSTASNVITAAGADSGAAMQASTFYYIYRSNSGATYAPNEVRACATGPGGYVNGCMSLGAAGNAANWRYVGIAYTNVSTQFTDSETARHVLSYYNRRAKRIYTCPGYNNNNSSTTYTVAKNGPNPLNGGTGATISFVTFDDEVIDFHYQLVYEHSTVSSYVIPTIYVDGSTYRVGPGNVVSNINLVKQILTAYSEPLNTNIHTLVLGVFTNNDTLTVYADCGAWTAGYDAPGSFIVGVVYG